MTRVIVWPWQGDVMGKMKEKAIEKSNVETRTFRGALDADLGLIIGYAAVFNERSVDLGGFTEEISPGAFRDAIQEDDIRALLNHDSNYVLGRNRSGTLKLEEDDKGLQVFIELPDTSWANDLKVSMKRGDVNQMSFQFQPVENDWVKEGDQVVHKLHKARLLDVSVVTFPAYPQTSAYARSMAETLQHEDMEQQDLQEQATRREGYQRHIDLLDRMR